LKNRIVASGSGTGICDFRLSRASEQQAGKAAGRYGGQQGGQGSDEYFEQDFEHTFFVHGNINLKHGISCHNTTKLQNLPGGFCITALKKSDILLSG